MQQKMYRYLSTLNSKSESQYFARSFPVDIDFQDGTNVRQYLLTVTR